MAIIAFRLKTERTELRKKELNNYASYYSELIC
jgi:hypothetical protein